MNLVERWFGHLDNKAIKRGVFLSVEDLQAQPRIKVQRARQAVDTTFDLLGFDRFDMRTLPLEERKRLLSELIHNEGPVRYCDHVIGRGTDFYAAISEHELEGVVAKLRDSP